MRLQVDRILSQKDFFRFTVSGVFEGKHMDLEESYRALGLKPGASLQEVRRSYYELVKFFHPDRHQASPGLLRKATEETKKLNLAYEHVCKVFGAGRRAAPE